MRLHRCQSKLERNEREKQGISIENEMNVYWDEPKEMEWRWKQTRATLISNWTSSALCAVCVCDVPRLTADDSMIRQINHSQKASSYTILYENTTHWNRHRPIWRQGDAHSSHRGDERKGEMDGWMNVGGNTKKMCLLHTTQHKSSASSIADCWLPPHHHAIHPTQEKLKKNDVQSV